MILQGNCLDKLKELPDNSVDSIVTDPPYHLVSIVKRFGKEGSAPAQEGKDGSFRRLSGGFMGKTWDGLGEDGIGIAQKVELWKECLRVLKPGGHLLAFSGTRTYHRMAVAIEDAGFEVRDMIEWVYGSGFPKSLNIGKAVDKLQGNKREVVGKNPNHRLEENYRGVLKDMNQHTGDGNITKGTSEWEGWGTALKPAHEPICMARKPLSEKTVAENCLKWGTGGINIDESRVGIGREKAQKQGVSNSLTQVAGRDESNLKEYPEDLGRFPANLIHDNSEEVRECFPESKAGKNKEQKGTGGIWSKSSGLPCGPEYGDNGNASRFFKQCEFTEQDFEYSPFFYCAKASRSERNDGCEELPTKSASELTGRKEGSRGLSGSEEHGNSTNPYANGESVFPRANYHPTVKPLKLMEYLIKMVTPKGGLVLDPFAGSGSTLVAAKQNGFQYIGIELTEEYIPIIEARLSAVETEGEE